MTKFFIYIIGVLIIPHAVFATVVSFPAGSFEGGTASAWTKSRTGAGIVTTPTESGNTFGRISVNGTGTGTLENGASSFLMPNSVYNVTAHIRSSTLSSFASNRLALSVLDNSDHIIKELSEDDLLNTFGTNIGSISRTLTPLLQGLAMQTNLVTRLKAMLLAVSESTDQTGLLSAERILVHMLLGQNRRVVVNTAELFTRSINGTLNIFSLSYTQLSAFLGVTPSSPLIAAVRNLAIFLPAQKASISMFVSVLNTMTTSDLADVEGLLTALSDNEELLPPMIEIFTYARVDDSLFANLTNSLTTSLLGALDPTQTGFQPVSMIFTTGENPPAGLKIRFSAGATSSTGQTVDVDDIGIKEFAFSASSPGASSDPLCSTPNVKIFGRKVRVVHGSTTMIRGTANIPLKNAKITEVQYCLASRGRRMRFRKGIGTSRWHVKARLQSSRTCVFVRAHASNGSTSPMQRIVLVHY